jgi:hypothetical protein
MTNTHRMTYGVKEPALPGFTVISSLLVLQYPICAAIGFWEAWGCLVELGHGHSDAFPIKQSLYVCRKIV